MKHSLYTLYLLVLLAIIPNQVKAQATTCSQDIQITTTAVDAICQADGKITVSLSGDTSNFTNVLYSLSSNDGVTSRPGQISPVFDNLPPDTYKITVQASCSIDPSFAFSKTAQDIVVGGLYVPTEVFFDPDLSRPSYNTSLYGCVPGTGIIVLDVTKGSGNYSFNLTKGPTGAVLGSLSTSRDGTKYTLSGDEYPAGDYQIAINDGCYTRSYTFTLGTISAFPYQQSFPNTMVDNTSDANCSSVLLGGIYREKLTADHKKYYDAGMYEVGYLLKDGTSFGFDSNPSIVTTSVSIGNQSYPGFIPINLSPYNSMHDLGTMKTFVRLKKCPEYRSVSSHFYSDLKISHGDYDCDNFAISYSLSNSMNGLCLPVSIKIEDTTDGSMILDTLLTEVYTFPMSLMTRAIPYFHSYKGTMTDASGKVITSSGEFTKFTSFRYDGTSGLKQGSLECDGVQYLMRHKKSACPPMHYKITNLETNTIDLEGVVTVAINPSVLMYDTVRLAYNTNYKFDYYYPNMAYDLDLPSIMIPAVEYKVDESKTLKISSGGIVHCSTYTGYVSFDYSNDPDGTVYTIFNPDGTMKVKSKKISTYNIRVIEFSENEYDYPPAMYTFKIDYPCGDSFTQTTFLEGITNQVVFETEKLCGDLKVTSTGNFYVNGTPINEFGFNMKIVEAPSGAVYETEPQYIYKGGSFLLNVPGTYVIATGYLQKKGSSSPDCINRLDTIVYTLDPMLLDPQYTSAYVCQDDLTGVITMKAKNGVAPYTYELWNADNTVKEGVADITTSDQAAFFYGDVDKTYTIRTTDDCGNSFAQQITMERLKTAIVLSGPANVCYGEKIEFQGLNMGDVPYSWTGPEGFTSTQRNPVIENATDAMSGWYELTIQPKYCPQSLTGKVYVNVYPEVKSSGLSDQEVYVRQQGEDFVATVTGGPGGNSYQWQTSTDAGETWVDIVGETTTTYTPPVHPSSGIYLYRLQISNSCGVSYSHNINWVVKPAYVPVNPNLRSKSVIVN